MSFDPNWWHTTTAVNGRAGPSTDATIKSVQPANHNFWASKQVNGNGRTWLVSNLGTHYAKEFCADGKAPKPKVSSRVASPAPGYRMSTPWGKKPNNRSYWQTRGHHTGVDYAAPSGAQVIAVRSGRVVRYQDRILGNVALLYADNGKTFWYCHLSKITRTGKIKAGQELGKVGMTGTGAAMGPHLHLEVRAGHTTSWRGRDTDPLKAW